MKTVITLNKEELEKIILAANLIATKGSTYIKIREIKELVIEIETEILPSSAKIG